MNEIEEPRKEKKKEWMWSPRQCPKQCQVCFGLVAWRLSLVELAACPPVRSLYSLPPLYSNPVAFRRKHSYEVHQPSFCLCGHNASFILRALKKGRAGDWKGPVSSASAQWRFECSLCLAICSRYQTTLSSCQNLPLSLLQPVKGAFKGSCSHYRPSSDEWPLCRTA